MCDGTHASAKLSKGLYLLGGREGGGNEGIAGGCWRRRRVSLDCVAWLVE